MRGPLPRCGHRNTVFVVQGNPYTFAVPHGMYNSERASRERGSMWQPVLSEEPSVGAAKRGVAHAQCVLGEIALSPHAVHHQSPFISHAVLCVVC